MKRFVIGTDRTTPEQDQAFYSILHENWPDSGWWHQLSETWLIADPTDTLTCSALRDAAMKAFPGVHLMVVEAAPRGWAGFGPSDTTYQFFTWMREQWGKQS